MNRDNPNSSEIGLSTQTSDSYLNIRDAMENETDGKSFQVKEHIPKRSNKKLLKLSYAIIAVILIILITILIAVFKAKTINEKSKVPRHLTEKVIISNNSTFWRYDLTSKTMELLYKAENAIIKFDILSIKNTIFWIENNVNESKILSTSIDSSNRRNRKPNILFQRESSNLSGIAVDYINENVYFLEKSIGALIVVNSKTKLYSIVLAELDQPQDIVLHSSEGLMFILQGTETILKVHMDGTPLNTVVNATGIISFAIDRKSRKIYWVSNFININRSDYNGKNTEIIIEDTMNIKMLSIAEDQLFWAWSVHYSTDDTFWSCLIDNGICKKYVMHTHESFRYPKILPFYSEADVSHPCSSDETCHDICLVRSGQNFSCACRLGTELNLDLKSCRTPQNFFVYIQGGVLTGSTLGTKRSPSSPNIIWPILLPSKFHNVVSKLEYDQHEDFLYFAMDDKVYRLRLKSGGNPRTLINSTSNLIHRLTFDWLSNILYYASQTETGFYIDMVNVRNNFEKFGTQEFKTDIQLTLRDIAVNPRSHYLFTCYATPFFSADKDLSNYIVTHKMDTEYVSHFQGQSSFYLAARIAVDYDENRVYVLYNLKNFRPLIQYSTSNSSDQISIKPNITMLVKEIQVHQQWLYLMGQTELWRFNKLTGADAVKVLPISYNNGRSISALTVVGAAVHREDDKNNLCFTSNGGCQQFCFSSPNGKRECGCAQNQNLTNEYLCG